MVHEIYAVKSYIYGEIKAYHSKTINVHVECGPVAKQLT